MSNNKPAGRGRARLGRVALAIVIAASVAACALATWALAASETFRGVFVPAVLWLTIIFILVPCFVGAWILWRLPSPTADQNAAPQQLSRLLRRGHPLVQFSRELLASNGPGNGQRPPRGLSLLGRNPEQAIIALLTEFAGLPEPGSGSGSLALIGVTSRLSEASRESIAVELTATPHSHERLIFISAVVDEADGRCRVQISRIFSVGLEPSP